MTAKEVRRMEWSLRLSEPENMFAILREIAAQIAELNARFGRIGPVTAPKHEAGK